MCVGLKAGAEDDEVVEGGIFRWWMQKDCREHGA